MAKNKSAFLLFCTMALMLSIILVDAQTFFTNGRYGKRSDLRTRVASRSTDERFFGGPRFGRSGNGGVILGNSEFDARNPERFFIGSRYGKRSEMEQTVSSPQIDESTSNSQERDTFLECYPIGIEQLYHCIERLYNTFSPYSMLENNITSLTVHVLCQSLKIVEFKCYVSQLEERKIKTADSSSITLFF